MYNQYADGQFLPLHQPRSNEESHQNAQKTTPRRPNSLWGELSGSLSKPLSGIFKHLSPEQFDTGDILLVLIILFLFLEGDNLELVITLGLMFFLGLNDD